MLTIPSQYLNFQYPLYFGLGTNRYYLSIDYSSSEYTLSRELNMSILVYSICSAVGQIEPSFCLSFYTKSKFSNSYYTLVKQVEMGLLLLEANLMDWNNVWLVFIRVYFQAVAGVGGSNENYPNTDSIDSVSRRLEMVERKYQVRRLLMSWLEIELMELIIY